VACTGGGDSQDFFVEPEVRRSEGGLLETRLRAAISPVDVAGIAGHRAVYEGQYPGPTLWVNAGDQLVIHLENAIPRSTDLHFHGFHVSPQGLSDDVFLEVVPGETVRLDVHIPPDHPAGLYWYHPHFHPEVAPEVYEGMSGAIVIEGDLDEVPGVKGLPQRLFVLKEIGVSANGERLLDYAEWNFPGSLFTVNGRLDPIMKTRPGQTERWRFLNASTAFTYKIAFDGHVLHQIAADGNTFREPSAESSIELVPGARFEAIVQIGEQGSYAIRTLYYDQGFIETPDAVLATVEVEGDRVETRPVPTELLPFVDLRGLPVDRSRTLVFSVQSNPTVFLIDGKPFDPDRIDQLVELGALEEWTIRNVSDEMHPFHIHVNPFQVVSVNGVPFEAKSYRDTVAIPPNGEFVFRSQFLDFTGKYVYHCHILPHEDNSMMGVVAVTEDGTAPPAADVARGLEVYDRAGCGGCHTLSTAGSTGTIGPNLDEHVAVMGTEGIANVIRFGRREMPSFRELLSEQEIMDVAALVRLTSRGHEACAPTPGGPDLGGVHHCRSPIP
jgi:FtsP/CotA-like multicopper oxidase with cupredoxin domain